jgi:hypothetical protein
LSEEAPRPLTRIEIEARLDRDRAWLLETYAALDERQLSTPVTPSEHDPEVSWNAKDHFVHLALIENNWVDMIGRFLKGDTDPVELMKDRSGAERSREQVMAAVHTWTESWARKHRKATLNEAVAVTQAARGRTLELLSELTDEQLTLKVPRAPWADGTVGGILAANAGHGRTHFAWVKDGWKAHGIEWARDD